VLELRGRDVHGDAHWLVGPLVRPAAGLGAGSREHEAAERPDHAYLLGERDEDGRRHGTALRVIPARERLDRGQPARPDLHDRLVEDRDLAAVERAAQVCFELDPIGERLVHRWLVRDEATLSLALSRIHREIGVAEQLVGSGLARDAQRAPNGGVHGHAATRDHKRRA